MFWSLHRSSLSLGRFLRGSEAVRKANMHRVWVAIVLVSCLYSCLWPNSGLA